MPLGGPSGGDGGRGGDVVLVVDEGLGSLIDLRTLKRVAATSGEHGRGKDQYGKRGKTHRIRVPPGTQVFDATSGELLGDLSTDGEELVAAKGGAGGLGNLHFVTPYDRAPRRATPGKAGELRMLRLELKLMADVGIIGYPNVGKSTLIATASRAKPKIANYPFTTLTPNLGVVQLGVDRSFVMADIPGIIEGASDGAGLGLRFLKHVQRNRLLLHLVSLGLEPDRDPASDYDTLRREMGRFDASLLERPELVALSRIDMPEVRERLPAFEAAMKERGIPRVYAFSSATREGMEDLLHAIEAGLAEIARAPEASEDTDTPGVAAATSEVDLPPEPAGSTDEVTP